VRNLALETSVSIAAGRHDRTIRQLLKQEKPELVSKVFAGIAAAGR
jgi:hypothetical protein